MKLSKQAEEVAKARYYAEGENWESMCRRVASAIAKAEKPELQEKYENLFFDMIYNQYAIPAGRILRNAGFDRALLNCYSLGVEDNIESIGQLIKDSLIISSNGGGAGIPISPLRPKGSPLNKKGGESSGTISFLKILNTANDVIKTGGERRTALLALMDVSHPEIIDFIEAKVDNNELTNFNISVAINNRFIEAVKNDGDWNLEFRGKIYKTIKARLIWDKIIDCMLKSAEPGLINEDLVRYYNNAEYFAPFNAPNPCISGNTIVATADGRKNITIKQLADEGLDVPVYCLDNNGNIRIKQMRNPRVTGYKVPVYKITLDSGEIITTKNHKFIMKDGSVKQANKLIPGDSINSITIYSSKFNSKSKTSYWWINNGFRHNLSEHRLIIQENFGLLLNKNDVIHHKDYNGLNNDICNLKIMSKKSHDVFHSIDMIGNNNPMRDKWWNKLSNDKKEEHKKKMAVLTKGINNGNSCGVTNKDLMKIAIEKTKKLGRKIKLDEWIVFAKQNSLPYNFSNYRENGLGTISKFLHNSCVLAGVDPRQKYSFFVETSKTTDLNIYWNGNEIKVIKYCEFCNNQFEVNWNNRENCYCSVNCGNKAKDKLGNINYNLSYAKTRNQKQLKVFSDLKYKLNRIPLYKEWVNECKQLNIPHRVGVKYGFKTYDEIKQQGEMYNCKVISVEFCGYEDVYNGTVDDCHNFFSGFEIPRKDGGKTYKFVANLQCGEIPLEANASCCLGNLVLPNFYTDKRMKWKELEKTINTMVRFLDNVLTVNNYPIGEIERQSLKSRRIGLGVTGLAELLLHFNLKYGSQESLFFIEKLFKFIRDVAYCSSINLAKEKGTFPAYSTDRFLQNNFVKTLPVRLKKLIEKYGLRNVALLTCPPVGSTSQLTPYSNSSGVEPILSKAYWRNDALGRRPIIHNEIVKNKGIVPDYFVESYDLTAEEHLLMQATIQQYVDNSISKTINFPKNTSKEELSNILLNYVSDLKGVTIYVDGSREGQVLTPMTEEEIKQYLNESESDIIEQKCKSGSCDL